MGNFGTFFRNVVLKNIIRLLSNEDSGFQSRLYGRVYNYSGLWFCDCPGTATAGYCRNLRHSCCYWLNKSHVAVTGFAHQPENRVTAQPIQMFLPACPCVKCRYIRIFRPLKTNMAIQAIRFIDPGNTRIYSFKIRHSSRCKICHQAFSAFLFRLMFSLEQAQGMILQHAVASGQCHSK